ncbi:glycosyltransferase [Sphingomonas baiyangensis]|uniref:Glycosyltransferase family 4 protein n=1 Tax=Sphingomonas baiyangensis TaxID=2572576 RepID=A0A4U1L328_9SPHN|nr:glycosyltransferase [Sphingomonas baiyangensis]TKD51297.1 glycosyltransferase family 4 protein [Sphingomonas baiyangensis]
MLRVLTLSTLFPDATRPNFGVFVERQAQALAARDGVAVRVVAPLGIAPFPLSLHPRYRALARLPMREQRNGLEVLRPRFRNLPGLAGRLHAAMLARALYPVLRDLRGDFAFDVIDASFFFPDGPAAIALGERFGVPVSIKARGADVHHWGRAPATAGQVTRAARRADGLLAVSAAMADDVAALGVPRERVRVHHTGVDQTRFTLADRDAAKAVLGFAGPLVVAVGALIARKGHDVLIEAIAQLPGVTLAIAGHGPERGALEALARRLGISERVRLLGSVAHADLPPLYAAADVSALASSSEGLANAWVEALACGTPIVITDAGGAAEVIDRPEAGRIVARDAAAFARGIGEMLALAPDRARVREAAARFTWERNAEALHAHLAALVATREL